VGEIKFLIKHLAYNPVAKLTNRKRIKIYPYPPDRLVGLAPFYRDDLPLSRKKNVRPKKIPLV